MTGAPKPTAGLGRSLVVGLGAPDRGDDAIGPIVAGAVARTVAARQLPGMVVVEREDPTSLVELMDPSGPEGGSDTVVIIDAVRSGAAAGTVAVIEAGADAPGLAVIGARLDPGPAGTHGFGLAGALELARALDRLPPRVVVIGVEATDFGHGAPLSDPVAAAIGPAVDAVVACMATRAPESERDEGSAVDTR